MSKVTIKKFIEGMEVKTNGVEFGVGGGQKGHLGDLVVRQKGLLCCEGKTTRPKGIEISWKELFDFANKLKQSRRSKQIEIERKRQTKRNKTKKK